MRRAVSVFFVLILCLAPSARSQPATAPSATSTPAIKIATYNVENWRRHFLAHDYEQKAATQPAYRLPEEIQTALRQANNENNWQVANVIADKNFDPDILVFQEGPEQADVEFFNRRWLNKKFETVIVFPSNSERGQNIGIMLKPGFRVVEKRDQYHTEKDTVPNERGDRLFARGPAFVQVEAPNGYRFWVGTNHQKSKSGNNVEVTAWRNREAKRTNEIINELAAGPVKDVIFLGDMNDDLGLQEFEQQGGGDTIANLVGTGDKALYLATRPLVEAGKLSFMGYWQTDYRSFIDHVFTTPSVKDRIETVRVIDDTAWTKVASDHLPVMIVVKP
jgi:endonuclease/exonuclease/phosphatase family metal-dependent hydrolase